MRQSISKKARFEIFKRDGFVCQYCGDHPPKAVLEIDHIIPVSKGGSSSDENLITSCFSCNRGKSDRDLSVAPETLAEKAKKIQEKEEQLRCYNKIVDKQKKRIEKEVWSIVRMFLETKEDNLTIRKDWFKSIRMFIEKLGFHEVQDAMDVSVMKGFTSDEKKFLYFCGVCWRKLKQMEEAHG